MEINIKARHTAITPEIRAYAEDKIGRATKLIDGPATEVEIELFAEKNPSIQNSQVAEVTVFTKGPVIRAREAATDMHAAIDLVSDRLGRRIKRYRGKVIDRHAAGTGIKGVEPEVTTTPETEAEEGGAIIVKRKAMTLKPMTTEEAVLQMELLGHDFFVFRTAEDGEVNILYRRRDGDFGVIAPREP